MVTRAAAIIVAAGSSTRMKGIDKAFTPILGKPMLAHSIEAFERAGNVDAIIIVARKDLVGRCRALVKDRGYLKVRCVCKGGPRRQDSTFNGLQQASGYGIVAVHDGSRPCVRTDVIEACVVEAERSGAVIAASPVHDTIKSVDPAGSVSATIDRSTLRAVHTPQVFRSSVLKQAYAYGNEDATDEAMLVERSGFRVMVYEDSDDNIKVTTRPDLLMAEAVLSQRAAQRAAGTRV